MGKEEKTTKAVGIGALGKIERAAKTIVSTALIALQGGELALLRDLGLPLILDQDITTPHTPAGETRGAQQDLNREAEAEADMKEAAEEVAEEAEAHLTLGTLTLILALALLLLLPNENRLLPRLLLSKRKFQSLVQQ